MSQDNLTSYSNQDLLDALKNFRRSECLLIADIVRHLAEVDSRQLYRDAGYSSLFFFCVQGLGYSEGAAQRRIVAARCLRDNPEVYTLLKEGKISLCSLSEVAKVLTPENKSKVLALSQGLPKQEAQRLAARFQAPTQTKREVVRAKRVLVRKTVPEQEESQNSVNASVATSVAAEPTFTMPAIAEPAIAELAIEERFSLSLEVDAECMQLISFVTPMPP